MTPRPRLTAAAAVLVALVALALYRSTLLPGFDFGDTPSFQVMGGDPGITPRDAYPLYFAVGAPFVWLSGDRAHGMNLASAVEGAVACGLVVLVAAEISGAVLPAAAAALLLAGSYTFWSQAVIAEVYALHACMMALSLLLLLRWERRPTTGRLAAFFLAYAIGFGNHLAMVLLLPGYAAFLLVAGPKGWRSVLTPRVVCLAVAIAVAGALQYAWNLHSLWLAPVPPHSLTEALGKFWFDVTKADWRETMVANVPTMMASERMRMYAFDVRQQFGLVGPLLAAAGLAYLCTHGAAPRTALRPALCCERRLCADIQRRRLACVLSAVAPGAGTPLCARARTHRERRVVVGGLGCGSGGGDDARGRRDRRHRDRSGDGIHELPRA